jgi:hypothetical protein
MTSWHGGQQEGVANQPPPSDFYTSEVNKRDTPNINTKKSKLFKKYTLLNNLGDQQKSLKM